MTRAYEPESGILSQRIGHAIPLSVEEALTSGVSAMTMATINSLLPEWLGDRVSPGLSLVSGGWDDWVQVDLVGWLHGSLGAQVSKRWDIQRNVRVYNDPDLRADLVINGETCNSIQPLLVVEILAESQLVPRPDYLNRMHYEAERLRAANLRHPYASARRMMLAVTMDPTTPTLLQKHDFGAVASTPDGRAAMWRQIDG